MATSKTTKTTKTTDKSDGKKSNILSIIIIVLLLIIILCGAAFGGFYIASVKTGANSNVSFAIGSSSNKPIKEITVPAGEFLVKLADERSRYAKTTITLSYNEESEFGKEYEQVKPMIQDAINSYLMSKKADEFTSANLEVMKKDLITKINDKLLSKIIINLYFTGLQVQ